MILVDTSIWIDFFNAPTSPVSRRLRELIEGREALAINGLIEMEILQGIRSDQKMYLVARMLKPYQYFPEVPRSWLERAAEIFRVCRRKGHTVRKSIDCIIAASALENGLTLMHKDRDFRSIQACFRNLDLLEVESSR